MEVKEYKFRNGDYSFSILNLGCAITSICTPDREGNIANVTLPFVGVKENPSVLLDSTSFYGLTVGRFANRISGASFKVGDRVFSFDKNDGENLLHSGPDGIWSRLWSVRHMDDGFLCSLKISESEDGFPGDSEFRVRFSMSSDGVFKIHYSVTCSETCPINLTNHTYFNLSGDPCTSILDHEARLESHRIVEVGEGLIPTGEVVDITGTAFDFSSEKAFGKDIDSPLLSTARGYDHAYVIDRINNAQRGFARFAHVRDPKSGRVLQAFTDLPAFHLYTGNFMDGECGYNRQCGFCLETEFYPDCVNNSSFPSCLVHPGELFESTTVYHFYTDKNS